MLKRIGTSARKDMERFLGKVYLETHVKEIKIGEAMIQNLKIWLQTLTN